MTNAEWSSATAHFAKRPIREGNDHVTHGSHVAKTSTVLNLSDLRSISRQRVDIAEDRGGNDRKTGTGT